MSDTKPSRSKKALVAGVGCLGVTLFCCVSGSALTWYANEQVGKLDAASVACDGQAVAGAELGELPAQVVAFQRGDSGRWDYFGVMLPSSWPDAEDASDARVVFCFGEEERERIEICDYDGTTLARYRYALEVRAVEAATGRELRNQRVLGRDPDLCPDVLSSTEVYGINVSDHEREDEGQNVSASDIDAVFRDLVTGAPAG